jgi:DNA modification methylase
MNIDTIICGDNATVLTSFEDECIDLTVTSPPYDNLRTYNGYSWNFESLAGQLYRVTKPGGVVVWVVGDSTIDGSETLTSFTQALYFKGLGFRVHDTMIYQTKKLPYGHNRYEQCFEYMFVFSKGRPNVFNPLTERTKGAGRINTYNSNGSSGREMNSKHGKKESARAETKAERIKDNIWFYWSGSGSSTPDSYAYTHPAVYPESLARDHILSWSNPGDIVLDPFIGSGTTAKMAKETGRHWIGIDISDEYCRLANRRVMGANVPLPMFAAVSS